MSVIRFSTFTSALLCLVVGCVPYQGRSQSPSSWCQKDDIDEDAQEGLLKVKWVDESRIQDAVDRLKSRSAILLSYEEATELGWPGLGGHGNLYLVRAGTVGPPGRSLSEIATKLDERVELQAFPSGKGKLTVVTSTLSSAGFPYNLAALVQSEHPVSHVRVICGWIR